jgi:hypothetical protein
VHRVQFDVITSKHHVITFDIEIMRTTLDIADDILVVAKEVALREKKTIGEIVSEFARLGLQAPNPVAAARTRGNASADAKVLADLGFSPFPRRKTSVTNAQVNAIRDAEGI